MPTRSGYTTLVCGVVCLVVARLFAIFELFIIGAGILALVGFAILWVTLNRRGLRASRAVEPRRLHAGEPAIVTLSLTSTGLLPSPVAQITDLVQGKPRADAHLPPMGRDRVARASYQAPAENRGLILIGPMRTRIVDPFGLAATARTSAPDSSILVLPAFDVIAPPPMPNGRNASRRDHNPGQDGSHGDEFSSLRAYVVGDDLRRVHWPSSAKSGELMVRNEHMPEEGESVVLLDVRKRVASAGDFERMVSAATSLVLACNRRGDAVRLKTTSGDDLAATNARGLARVVDHLALVTQIEREDVWVTQQASRVAQTSVVVAGNSVDMLSGLSTIHGVGAKATVVQFADSAATAPDRPTTLRSRTMINVGPRETFVDQWSARLPASPASVSGSR